MECKTIDTFDENGVAITKPKLRHSTMDAAQTAANIINNKKNIFIKRVAYHCNECDGYHVGTTFEMLENKKISKKKMNEFLPVRLKIVGSVDLSQFEKKPNDSKLFITAEIKKENELHLSRSKSERKRFIHGKLYINGLIWRFYVKEKIVKVITPEGLIKMPKLHNFYTEKDGVINATISSNKIRRYLEQKYKRP